MILMAIPLWEPLLLVNTVLFFLSNYLVLSKILHDFKEIGYIFITNVRCHVMTNLTIEMMQNSCLDGDFKAALVFNRILPGYTENILHN
jgi:hypothetical protein